MQYRLGTDALSPPMTAGDLMDAARIAFAGGLFEAMPSDASEAIGAFEDIGIEIEEINEGAKT